MAIFSRTKTHDADDSAIATPVAVDSIVEAVVQKLRGEVPRLAEELAKQVNDSLQKVAKERAACEFLLPSSSRSLTSEPHVIDTAFIEQLDATDVPDSTLAGDARSEEVGTFDPTQLTAAASLSPVATHEARTHQELSEVVSDLKHWLSQLREQFEKHSIDQSTSESWVLNLTDQSDKLLKAVQDLEVRQGQLEKQLKEQLNEQQPLSAKAISEVVDDVWKSNVQNLTVRYAENHRALQDNLSAMDKRWETWATNFENSNKQLSTEGQKIAQLITDLNRQCSDLTSQASSLSQESVKQIESASGQLAEAVRQILTERFESQVLPNIASFAATSEKLTESIRFTFDSSLQTLSDARKALESSHCLLATCNSREEKLSQRLLEVETREKKLDAYRMETERLETELGEKRQAHDHLQQQNRSLTTSVQQLEKLQLSLVATQRPALLQHTNLLEEVAKLGNDSVESLLLMGSIYQFQNSLTAVQRKSDDVDLLSHLQEVIVQLGIALMRHINHGSANGLIGEKWRRAVEESVQSWFKIHLPIVGQPFNLSLMDVSKPGTVRVVRSWAVFSNDQRLRSKLAIVE